MPADTIALKARALAVIRATPGIGQQALAAALNVSVQKLRYHLEPMIREGAVTSHMHGRRTEYRLQA